MQSQNQPIQPTYDPKQIEATWQQKWNAANAYRVLENATDALGKLKPKFYACSMLPYPSGKLHMGHVRNYTINDVMLRQMRMNGYNVLMPMGWDAFGMPAENAAIANNVPPAKWTYANIEDMKAQMQPLGLAFDWTREVTTCSPDYYRWNQWLFLKMLEKGIAYRKTQTVNWDPVDQTVLANEQVIDGRGWRSGAVVEKREIPGYYLGITQYAEELLDHVTHKLPGWPERVRIMQQNWIGKSVGVRFAFPHTIQDDAGALVQDGKLFVFTTRADTIMGVTFCAVAAEHPIATVAAKNNAALQTFIAECKQGGVAEADMATAEKKGMDTGLTVNHPLTGAAVPVWIGNYVLMTYGDGAVMGVPAHDERDFAFAKKYALSIKQVVAVTGKTYSLDAWGDWYGDKTNGTLIASGKYDGLGYDAAVDSIAADLTAAGGEKKNQYRLRDWGISRQRYWGTPIPLIHCDDCGVVTVPEKDLPVILPDDCIPDGTGNPLNKHTAFLNVPCPKCAKPAKRETDTMDTFVDSSWYYMRYCSPDSANAMVDARNDYWMPMDQYIGGIEHAVLHLLYARFWTKVMRDFGLIKFDEPFTNLFTQGMLLNESFYREDDDGKKRWFYPTEVKVRHDEKGKPISAIANEDGLPVHLGGIEKMSKSKNNVVEPKDIIAAFGADTARFFTMFAGPPDMSAAWSDTGVAGASRYLHRLWAFAVKHQNAGASIAAFGNLSSAAKKCRYEVHLSLKQANADYKRLQYNTVLSACMKILNTLDTFSATNDAAASAVIGEGLSILLRLLYPVCPHITAQLWLDLGYAKNAGDMLDTAWPQVDGAALQQDELELVVQINGKLRSAIRVAASASKEVIEQTALADAQVQHYLEGRAVKKVIVVAGKLVNVVA
jgi:leucyl-tRNA synthetase